MKVVNQYDHRERDKHIDNLDYDLDQLDNLLDQMNMSTQLVEG